MSVPCASTCSHISSICDNSLFTLLLVSYMELYSCNLKMCTVWDTNIMFFMDHVNYLAGELCCSWCRFVSTCRKYNLCCGNIPSWSLPSFVPALLTLYMPYMAMLHLTAHPTPPHLGVLWVNMTSNKWINACVSPCMCLDLVKTLGLV